jgi:SOS-response transcriptional repressor LexA
MGNTIISFHNSIMGEEHVSSLEDDAHLRLALQRHATHLQQLLVEHPASTYYMQVEGDGNHASGIFPNDIAIIDRSIKPSAHDFVVAVVENEHILTEYSSYIQSKQEVEVWGVVTGVIRTFRHHY